MNAPTEFKKNLTRQQQIFVKNYSMGMSQTNAARQAGYKFPVEEAVRTMRLPHIREAIELERKKYEKVADVSRKKVMDGLLETVDIAKQTGEPMAMVGAWREIARICGYYAAEKKEVAISINGAIHVNQLENMNDAELLKIIEGESIRVEDIEDIDADALLPHFPQPEVVDAGS